MYAAATSVHLSPSVVDEAGAAMTVPGLSGGTSHPPDVLPETGVTIHSGHMGYTFGIAGGFSNAVEGV